MKWIIRLGIVIVFLPVMFAAIWGLYEIFGMCVNHLATREQTLTLQRNLETEISDLEIINVYSETGNTSGTGNHVDCLSSVRFSTEMEVTEIEDCLSDYYEFSLGGCYVGQTEDGNYIISVNMPAPFRDNIEGH